jgi:hypothetical protein
VGVADRRLQQLGARLDLGGHVLLRPHRGERRGDVGHAPRALLPRAVVGVVHALAVGNPRLQRESRLGELRVQQLRVGE